MVNTKYKIISYAISKLNLELYEKGKKEIQDYIYHKQDIPYDKLSEFMGLLLPNDFSKVDDNLSACIILNNMAVAYFRECAKGTYDFNFTRTCIIGKKNKLIDYSLQDLLLPIIMEYFKIKEKKPGLDLKETLLFYYDKIKDSVDMFFPEELKKRYSHYKMAVLAAFLTLHSGFKISNSKNITNHILFQSTKNYLKAPKKSKGNI